MGRLSAAARRAKADERAAQRVVETDAYRLRREGLSVEQAIRRFWPELSAPSWRGWHVVLRALLGLTIPERDPTWTGHVPEPLAYFAEHTGGRAPPTAPVREAWAVCGRRSGKSRIAALLACYVAVCRDHSAVLAPGEVGTIAIVASDRKQARNVKQYVEGFLKATPALEALIDVERRESIDLRNRVRIEIHTASFRGLRGYSLLALIADEVSFWQSDEDGHNPDREVLTAARPGLATVPSSLLVAITTPYRRAGETWRTFEQHYGKDSPVLVWRAPSRAMNPTLPEEFVAAELERDPEAAGAEYLAQFRSDIASFVDLEALQASVLEGVLEVPPEPDVQYFGFVDPAGGTGGDSFTLAIAHADKDTGMAVLDLIREVRPKFSPESVVEEFAGTLKPYRLSEVRGDRYAAAWVVESFKRHEITYTASPQNKSDLYLAVLGPLNSGRVALLDHPRLLAQLRSLERRTSRTGRDLVDHPPRAHDDVANAVAGALTLALDRKRADPIIVGPWGNRVESLRLHGESNIPPWRAFEERRDYGPGS
jgi:hypothetical protein